MTSKKFINLVNNVVHENLSGLCSVFPQLDYHESKRVVLMPNWKNRGDKVSIICGGGSGHEPFAAGFVGSGMLTASIAGEIFAAPPANHIFYALKCVTGIAGTLVIIPNYTGDCLNFGIAIEKFRQMDQKVLELVVGDDCSIPVSEQGRAGKRGLVGMLFVIKIAGALAEVGKSIEDIFHHAKLVSKNTATYGVCLQPCALPGQGAMFELPSDEVEIGLGVHGEAGYERIKIQSASKIVEIMLDNLCKSLSLISGDFVAVLINNFGAASQLEQGIVAYEVVLQLRKKNIHPLRVYSGVLMTSLDSSGVHVSILKLINDYKDIYISSLDEKTDAPCWPGCAYSLPPSKIEIQPTHDDERTAMINIGPQLSPEQSDIFKKCLANACRAILKNEVILNDLDRGCGDGDCGSTHKLLAEGILSSLEDLNINYPASSLMELSAIAEGCMGGTSGAVYSLMFTTMSSTLSRKESGDWGEFWLRAWQCAIESVMKYSKARLGDRTMLDALSPACGTFGEYLSHGYRVAIEKAAEAARNGCESTRNMIPRAGRAAYVKQSKFLKEVDAGAFGVIIWINAISEILLDD